MTQRRWILLVAGQGALLVLLLAALWWRTPAHGPAAPGLAGQPATTRPDGLSSPARGSEEGAAPAGGAATAGAAALSLQLRPEVIAASGIRMAPLQSLPGDAPEPCWGEVLDAAPLAGARLRLQQASADEAQWPLQVAAARQELARQQALWDAGGLVAERVLEQARSSLAVQEQRAEAARNARQAVRDAVQAEWGAEVLLALERPEGGALAGVLAGQQRLLLVAVPAGQTFRQGRVVHADGSSAGPAAPAQRFAPALRALGAAVAPTAYWLAAPSGLRSGQRVLLQPDRPPSVRSSASRAVLLPESAVIWQSGQAWVWLPLPDHRFERRSVTPGRAVAGGWLLDGALQAGQPVVVEGAQLLLSEESRALIRNENGD